MGGEPADDNGAGAAQHLAEQPPGAVEVDEAGMPSIHQHPLAGGRVLFPARLAAAGLIDAEHPHRRRRAELTQRGPRRVHDVCTGASVSPAGGKQLHVGP